MKHLTYTGFDAGKPLCGAPRNSSGSYEHAVYARLDSRERINGFCKSCLATWLAYAFDGEPLPDWPVTPEDIKEIENSIPKEFASDSEMKSFREKLKHWTTAQ